MKHKKHFLVVDDSELSLRVTEMLLNSFGISGDYVSGADAAFTALSRRDYDLVLIDYLMPGMNGIETVEVIRRMAGGQRRGYYASLPILILTAEENEELVAEMIASGANGVLTKPLKAEDLKKAMTDTPPYSAHARKRRNCEQSQRCHPHRGNGTGQSRSWHNAPHLARGSR